MSSAVSRLSLLLLFTPLLVSGATCGFGEVYEAPSPEPDKCWECPSIDGALEHGKNNIYELGKSYTEFFCKYWISQKKKVTYIPDKATERIEQWVVSEDVPAYCYYDGNGLLSSVNGSNHPKCKLQATAVPNCTPVKFENYTGAYERCCTDGCKLETPGTCFFCPHSGGDFVDVDVEPGFPLECNYHGLSGPLYRPLTRCWYDATTGEAVVGPRGQQPCGDRATQRSSCNSTSSG